MGVYENNKEKQGKGLRVQGVLCIDTTLSIFNYIPNIYHVSGTEIPCFQGLRTSMGMYVTDLQISMTGMAALRSFR